MEPAIKGFVSYSGLGVDEEDRFIRVFAVLQSSASLAGLIMVEEASTFIGSEDGFEFRFFSGLVSLVVPEVWE